MRRLFLFFIVMLLPSTLMAMKPISDSEMSTVSGQAGMSIYADITMNLSFAGIGWGDSDGDPAAQMDGGWLGIDSLKIDRLHIWPRTDFTMESTAPGAGGWADLQPLTIDVVTMTDTVAAAGSVNSQAGLVNNHVTAVRIGIPTSTIQMASMTGNVVLGPYGRTDSIGGIVNGEYYAEKTAGAPAFDQLMGKFYISGLNMAMGKDGAIQISAHGQSPLLGSSGTLSGSGVTIELQNVNIPYLLIDNAAWGDIDGK